MKQCHLIIRKNAESKNPKAVRTKNGKIMLLSNFSVCYIKSRNFLKQQKRQFDRSKNNDIK